MAPDVAVQASSLRKTQTARLRLAQAEAELKQKQDSAKSVRNEMKDAKEEANERLNAAEGLQAGEFVHSEQSCHAASSIR